MMQPRSVTAAASVDGRLYVCGGHNGQQELSSAERYDPGAGAWEAMLPLSQRRSGAAVAVAAGRLYVCGGYDGWEVLSSVERLGPEAAVWEPAPAMSERRDHAAAAVFTGGLLPAAAAQALGGRGEGDDAGGEGVHGSSSGRSGRRRPAARDEGT